MEIENTNQQPNFPQNPMQNQPSDSIINTQKGNFPIIIGGIIILLLVVGVGVFVLGQRTNNTVSTSASISTPNVIPQENVLYLDTYEGVEAIFFTNKEAQKYFESGAIEKSSPYIGTLQQANGKGTTPFDYKKLTNPRRISININNSIRDIGSLKLDNTKTMLYVSLSLEEKTSIQYPDNLVNRVYQVNLSNLSSKEVWSNEIGSNKYTGKGVVYIDQIVEDKFLAMMLNDCYACDDSSIFKKTIIVNIATKNENYLEGVGELQFDLSSNNVSYKELAPFKEACESSPGCDNDGTKTVMKPSGQVFTEKLP